MASDKDNKNNVHSGHRARVRQRFINDGTLDNFEEHQVLELLLFYVYPMRDTNEISHRLLAQYGSLYNLLNTSPSELINNAGLSENAAVFLSMLPYVCKKYLRSEFKKSKELSDSVKASKFMSSFLKGQNYESMYMISLNVRKKIIAVDEISKGEVSSVSVDSRKIIEKALLNRAKFVIIGHNHPAGTCQPSENDMFITQRLINELKIIKVYLIDHIIVCNDNTYSFYEHRHFNLTYNPDMD